MLPPGNRLRSFYLAYLSQPASDRPVYRAILREKARSFLELGLGIGQRAVRMIEVAGRYHPLREIHFTAVDLFEARTAVDGPGVTLKMAHRLLGATGARIQLVPGQLCTGLARTANSLGQIDLVVLSARLDSRSLVRAWFYLPRLLHQRSQVFQERILPGGRTSMQLVDWQQVETLAASAASLRAA